MRKAILDLGRQEALNSPDRLRRATADEMALNSRKDKSPSLTTRKERSTLVEREKKLEGHGSLSSSELLAELRNTKQALHVEAEAEAAEAAEDAEALEDDDADEGEGSSTADKRSKLKRRRSLRFKKTSLVIV
jgi:hypothetical protein